MNQPLTNSELREKCIKFLNKVFDTSPMAYTGHEALEDLYSLVTEQQDAIVNAVIGDASGINPNAKDFYDGYCFHIDQAHTTYKNLRGER